MCAGLIGHMVWGRSAAACLLRLWVWILPGAWMFVVSIVFCQGEVSLMSWSLIQRRSANCGESCVISKLQVCGGHGPCWTTTPQKKIASGVYKLKRHNCEEVFSKQIGRLLKMRCKKCVRYIRANDAQLVCTLHNLVLDMNTTLWKTPWIWMEQHKRMESALSRKFLHTTT